MRGHRYADPLAAPGEADLTAHVDFAALCRAAAAEARPSHGPMPQGEFLLALGLAERAGRLGANADAADAAALPAAVERLAGPDADGHALQGAGADPPGIAPPPFPAA